MGCAPFEKPKKKHRKGLWSPDEDERLRSYIQKHGHGCWSSVPVNAGLQRNGKSCRLRWINYLRPGLKRGAFSITEEDAIFTLHKILGNKWSQIAHHLPGRSDNEIKNYWHSYLKKRLLVAKVADTDDVEATSNESDYIKGQILGLQSSSSSSIPSLQESVDHIIKPSQNLSLPKVLFADWLSLDQDLGNINVLDFKNVNVNINHSPHIHGMELETNNNYVDDMLPSTIFKLDCHSPIDYFPGEFNMNQSCFSGPVHISFAELNHIRSPS